MAYAHTAREFKVLNHDGQMVAFAIPMQGGENAPYLVKEVYSENGEYHTHDDKEPFNHCVIRRSSQAAEDELVRRYKGRMDMTLYEQEGIFTARIVSL